MLGLHGARRDHLCNRFFILLASVIVSASVPAPIRAQVEATRYPLHYIRTHKVLLLSDLVFIGAIAAESVTSHECLNAMRAVGAVTSLCGKQGYGDLKVTPLFILANHVAYRIAPAPELRYALPYVFGLSSVYFARWADRNASQTYLLWKYRCYNCVPNEDVRIAPPRFPLIPPPSVISAAMHRP